MSSKLYKCVLAYSDYWEPQICPQKLCCRFALLFILIGLGNYPIVAYGDTHATTYSDIFPSTLTSNLAATGPEQLPLPELISFNSDETRHLDLADGTAIDGASTDGQPVDEAITNCADFPQVFDSELQIQTVEANPNCAEMLVQEMILKPAIYLDAFYALIESETASDALWWAVFQQMRADNFRFPESIVRDMHQNLGGAIDRCIDGDSCEQWRTFIVPALSFGELYRCPQIEDLEVEKLLASVSYGDFYCTESLAQKLGELATFREIQYLMELASDGETPWARRNAIRVIGRLIERPGTESIQLLFSQMLSARMVDLMLDRLIHDPSEDVLLDAIWILDTFYHPSFQAQTELARITRNKDASPELRFRAMASVSRLIQEKNWLRAKDMIFLEKSLESFDPWVRGYAAFATQSIQELTLRPYQERRLLAALEDAYAIESEFSTKAAIAQALDSYNGSELLAQMQVIFEKDKLAQNLSEGHILVRSGLTPEQIPPKVSRMQGVEQAFFDIFEQAFRTPTPESADASLELLLFATQADYQEYMDAFVGYGSDAGGLYLETDKTLYTYQRGANESRYTVDHLIQHEYTHYLMGRYIFPGLWTDLDYHVEPKGWIDEGTAEYFGELELNGEQGYRASFSSERLLYVCDIIGEQSLATLLSQRAGYDQPGTFNYDLAWSFMKYLIENQPTSAKNLLKSFRDETYLLEDFSTITGFESVEAIESEWRQYFSQECTTLILNTGGPTSDTPLDEFDSSPGSAGGPKRYDEPFLHQHETLEHEIVTIGTDEPSSARFGGRQLGAPPPPTESNPGAERVIRLIDNN